MKACEKGLEATAALLIDKGADVHAKTFVVSVLRLTGARVDEGRGSAEEGLCWMCQIAFGGWSCERFGYDVEHLFDLFLDRAEGLTCLTERGWVGIVSCVDEKSGWDLGVDD
eukprot:2551614-Rhodomonas_salina.1